jgi:hypothetical protein
MPQAYTNGRSGGPGSRGLLRATHESHEMRLARMRWRVGRGHAAPPMAAWTLFHGLRFISAWNNSGLGTVGNLHIAIPLPVCFGRRSAKRPREHVVSITSRLPQPEAILEITIARLDASTLVPKYTLHPLASCPLASRPLVHSLSSCSLSSSSLPPSSPPP